MISVWTINRFGRRPLLLIGHTGIAISHFLIGIFIITKFNAGVLIMIGTFLIIYQNTSGPVSWAYATETCTDISLGVSI